jgi:co-chaperonin GroES (HSP10)
MSTKLYKKLLGNRVYVNVPKKEEKSKIIVDSATKEDLQREMLKKMSKLTIQDVGDLVSSVKAGDVVLVDPSKLKEAMLIPLTEDKDVLLVSPFDIIHVW